MSTSGVNQLILSILSFYFIHLQLRSILSPRALIRHRFTVWSKKNNTSPVNSRSTRWCRVTTDYRQDDVLQASRTLRPPLTHVGTYLSPLYVLVLSLIIQSASPMFIFLFAILLLYTVRPCGYCLALVHPPYPSTLLHY
jgi:hypothetical protein